ncbi:MAG: hypothetical protein ABFR95_08395 [Actinomycetota bacterium]
MGLILNIIGAVALIAGVMALVKKQWLYGGVLIVVAIVVGGFGFIV